MIAKKSDPSTRLRLPQPLMKKVSKAAMKSGRSLNSEICIRVAESFKRAAAAART